MNSGIDNCFYDIEHFLARQKKLSKKHQEEVACAIENWSKAMEFFQNANVEALRRSGLVRRESNGILATDQRGSRKKPPHLIRLYFFPWENEQGKHCMVFTVGDKNTQQQDNLFCSDALRKEHLI